MSDESIRERNLARAVPAPTDDVRLVRNGKSLLARAGLLPTPLPAQQQIDALKASQQTSAIYANTLTDLNAVTGTYVNQGAFVLNGDGAGQYRWTGSAWQFLRGDLLAAKADNHVAAAITGANAALLTQALEAILIQQGLRTRIPGLSLADGAELEVRDTEPVRGVSALLMGGDRKATAYLHEVGDLVLPSAPRSVTQLQQVRSGMAQERDKIYGSGHNQWIFPLFASMNGRRYHTSIGQGSTGPRVLGDVQVSERGANTRWMQYAVARQESVRNTDTSDDHNAPCVLLDPRDEAPFPVMVFGADHSDSSSRLRLWRSRTPDCAALEAPIVVDVTAGITSTGGMSYAQAFRDPYNPDWAYVLSRQGNTSNAVWWLHRSNDGFASCECTKLFAGDDLYLIAKPSRDGLCQHIVIQQHPLNGTDQRVLYLRYVFEDGSLRDADDEIVVEDVWVTDAFRPFTTAGATELYDVEAGRKKRLFDAMETADGKLEVVLIDFETSTYLGDAIHVSLEFGNSPVVTEIGGEGSAGYPLELSNSNAYFGGLCLTGAGAVVMARWERESPGSGELAKWTLSAGTWSKGAVLQSSTGATDKLGRPVVCVDFAWDGARIVWNVKPSLTYLRGTYGSYSNFSFDMTEVSL